MRACNAVEIICVVREIEMSKFQIFLPIGAALLILHSIEFFVDMMAKRPEKEEATDD